MIIYILIISIIILFVLSLLFITNRHKKKYTHLLHILKIEQTHSKSLESENQRLELTLNDSKRHIIQLQQDNTSYKDIIAHYEKPVEDIHPPAPPIQNKLDDTIYFYAGIPSKKGWNTITHDDQQNDFFYSFKTKDNKQANFQINNSSEAILKDIIYLRKDTILPACRELNKLANFQHIRTMKPGIAVLEGNTWIIKEKAEIKYE